MKRSAKNKSPVKKLVRMGARFIRASNPGTFASKVVSSFARRSQARFVLETWNRGARKYRYEVVSEQALRLYWVPCSKRSKLRHMGDAPPVELEPPLSCKACLLRALVDAPGYGLELIERVRARTGGRIEMGQGSVYPALRDLEREGLVLGRDERVRGRQGGRPRRIYRLTESGARAAEENDRIVRALFGLPAQ